MKVLLIRVPVGLSGGFQQSEPFQTKGDVMNFVLMNGLHNGGAFWVPRGCEIFFEFQCVIEVPPFECQRHPGQIIEHRLEFL